jgi:hypothetical protein
MHTESTGVKIMRTHAAYRADMAFIPARKPEMISCVLPGSLLGRRIAVASAEPEDAHLTGMTRSLDRRLLALNLRAGASPIPRRKVA